MKVTMKQATILWAFSLICITSTSANPVDKYPGTNNQYPMTRAQRAVPLLNEKIKFDEHNPGASEKKTEPTHKILKRMIPAGALRHAISQAGRKMIGPGQLVDIGQKLKDVKDANERENIVNRGRMGQDDRFAARRALARELSSDSAYDSASIGDSNPSLNSWVGSSNSLNSWGGLHRSASGLFAPANSMDEISGKFGKQFSLNELGPSETQRSEKSRSGYIASKLDLDSLFGNSQETSGTSKSKNFYLGDNPSLSIEDPSAVEETSHYKRPGYNKLSKYFMGPARHGFMNRIRGLSIAPEQSNSDESDDEDSSDEEAGGTKRRQFPPRRSSRPDLHTSPRRSSIFRRKNSLAYLME